MRVQVVRVRQMCVCDSVWWCVAAGEDAGGWVGGLSRWWPTVTAHDTVAAYGGDLQWR